MKPNAAYNSYQQNSVAVESPTRLIEMLYEGILRFASMAKRCIDSEDIEKNLLYQSHNRYFCRITQFFRL